MVLYQIYKAFDLAFVHFLEMKFVAKFVYGSLFHLATAQPLESQCGWERVVV